MIAMKKILYLTDLYYVAKGRNYYEEDLYITDQLKNTFDLVLCHPCNVRSFEQDVDVIVFRNTGGVSGFKNEYNAFVDRVRHNNLKTFNEFVGKADMCGKQYLLDLTAENFPVIPTVENLKNLSVLPNTEKYVVKPKDGADSVGLKFVTKEELRKGGNHYDNMLIQPAIDFVYEVSFYFLNDKLEYALYAPDKTQRWNLKKFAYSDEDLAFAKKFIRWNNIKNGIQRVDACRTTEGDLLLVELEDLNPYLSVLELDDVTREKFLTDWIDVLDSMI